MLADDLYLRGGQLVRLGTAAELPNGASKSEPQRVDPQAVIIPANQEFLRRELTRRATFQVYRRREDEWVAVDCPAALASNILKVAESPHWRPLTAIARAPFLRPDLSVCEAPGYDAATGIYYQPSQTFPPIPTAPTRSEAQAALEVLLAPFDEFPFQSESSRSVFAAHVLTAIVRPAVGTTPVFFYTAPTVATGKTLLSKGANLIATGNDPALSPYTDDANEQRKVLLSTLLAGDSGLLFDNVPNGVKVRSSVLCAFATASVYSDRKLGTNENKGMVNTVLVALTGNNLTPAGDLARRSLVCRLDADAETRRGRTFCIPHLVTYATEHRAELLVAALIVIRAHAVAGQPRVARPLESFETWSQMVRDPLAWLEMADPVDTQELEADDDVEAVRAAFTAIASVFGTEKFTARGLAGRYGPDGDILRAALETAGCSDAGETTKVGYWLRENRDKVAGDLKLIRSMVTAHGGVAEWKLRLSR